MSTTQATNPIALQIGQWASEVSSTELPESLLVVAQRLLLDVTGLCIAARHTDYVQSIVTSCPSDGNAIAIGQPRGLDSFSAALVNGTAAHGEDYDDTFEGTPVHVGAVVLPCALATCATATINGDDLLRGIVTGGELMCRMALVTPTAMHRAGFHPTAVIGAMGATLTACVALRLDARTTASALGIAGSMAAGIIEYLAAGTWTKRLHAGWAAQSGLRAALLARSGFSGPLSVFEGQHGFFHAFTNGDVEPDFQFLTDLPKTDWYLSGLAFKPYPCGTMVQPFIDCALKLYAQGIRPADIRHLKCPVGEGTVHRLWEPLAEKRSPSSSYSAKFSVPYGIAAALCDGQFGLAQFAPGKIDDPAIATLCQKISYEIDPDNEYPANYSGQINAHLENGLIVTVSQPHLRGGAREPLTDEELAKKFLANAATGNWSAAAADQCQKSLLRLFSQSPISDLSFLRG